MVRNLIILILSNTWDSSSTNTKNYSYHLTSLCNKLTRALGMLKKIRHYVNTTTLRSIYFAIFSSIMTYAAIIWGQNKTLHFNRVQNLQNKALEIINFANFRESPLISYKKSNILHISDHAKLQKFLYVHDSIYDILPRSLCNVFEFLYNKHSYPTRISRNNNIALPKSRTKFHGINSITFQAGTQWNFFNNHYIDFNNFDRSKCKAIITKHFLESY